jgi:hypothetical protein
MTEATNNTSSLTIRPLRVVGIFDTRARRRGVGLVSAFFATRKNSTTLLVKVQERWTN